MKACLASLLLFIVCHANAGPIGSVGPRPVSDNLAPGDAKVFYAALSGLGVSRIRDPWQPDDPNAMASWARLDMKLFTLECWGDFSNGTQPMCFISWNRFVDQPGEKYQGYQIPHSYQVVYVDGIMDPGSVDEIATKILNGKSSLKTTETKEIYSDQNKIIGEQPILQIECSPDAGDTDVAPKSCQVIFNF